jgi:hypothetical protein
MERQFKNLEFRCKFGHIMAKPLQVWKMALHSRRLFDFLIMIENADPIPLPLPRADYPFYQIGLITGKGL